MLMVDTAIIPNITVDSTTSTQVETSRDRATPRMATTGTIRYSTEQHR